MKATPKSNLSKVFARECVIGAELADHTTTPVAHFNNMDQL